MNWTPELQSFIRQHLDDDVDRLLLSAGRFPQVDVRVAVEQIAALKQLKEKLPEWYAKAGDLQMGGRVPAEQCSSERTARYKKNLVEGDSLCDLTGGMGVDFYYMAQGLSRAIYTERQSHLCEAANHNFTTLGLSNFEIREGDGRELPLPDVDTIYLDPARRSSTGDRVYDLAECEPDVVAWQEELLKHCRKLVVKISPMADIKRTLLQLRHVTDVHVVAVKNECKELLVEMRGELTELQMDSADPLIHCVDFRTSDEVHFDFRYSEELQAEPKLFGSEDEVGWLYEPDVTVLKSGAFRLMSDRFGLRKLDANSHLYVGNRQVPEFPGRLFQIEETIPFSSKTLKMLKQKVPQANVAARNFPMTADQLRNRAKIKDGGSVYLFATATHAVGNVLFCCKKVLLSLLVLLVLAIFCGGEAWAKSKKNRKNTLPETIESILSDIAPTSPFRWLQGMQFVFLGNKIGLNWQPESPSLAEDTLGYQGTIWTFDAIVSEEDWMGQQVMKLRFLSPKGRAYRFDTGRSISQKNDTTYIPMMEGFVPVNMVQDVDRKLRARTFYILINDERIEVADSIRMEKFVPVRIDSVSCGIEQAPLRIHFTENDIQASFVSSLPGSREVNTSTPIQRFLSVEDPYRKYPNITPETWAVIQRSELVPEMTTEEVRLSIGRPLRFENITTKNGLVERWYYSNSRMLEFWDNRLSRIAREK